jgi:hypothetical protein
MDLDLQMLPNVIVVARQRSTNIHGIGWIGTFQ